MKNGFVCFAVLFAMFVFASFVCAEDPSPKVVFEIPKLEGIMVDGDGEDWGDNGYPIENIKRYGGPTATIDSFVKLGWDTRGVLFLVTVKKDNANWFENRNDGELWNGDGVELYISPRQGDPNVIQWVIAAGMNNPNDPVRTSPYDFRVDEDFKNMPLDIQAEVCKREDRMGYTLEVLIPWDGIGLQNPTIGREVGVQIIINAATGPDGYTPNCWYPGLKVFKFPNHLHRVKLAEKSGPRDVLQVSLFKMQWYSMQMSVGISKFGSYAIKNKMVTFTDQDNNVITNVEYTGGRKDVLIKLPPFGKGYKKLIFKDGEEGIGAYEVDTDAMLLEQLQKYPMAAKPFVFNGDAFPTFDFVDPARVKALIGDYNIETKFFDAQKQEAKKPAGPGRYGAVVSYGLGTKRMNSYITVFKTAKPLEGEAVPSRLAEATGISEKLVTENQAAITNALAKNDAAAAQLLAALSDRTAGIDKESWSNDYAIRDNRWWLRMRHAMGEDIKQISEHVFAVKYPPDYDQKSGKKLPLLMYCPGRGFDCDGTWAGISTHSAHGIFRVVDPCPMLTVLPHSFWGYKSEGLLQIFEIIEVLYPVDPHYVFVAGHSGGAEHARKVAASYPDRFSVVMPMAHGPWFANDLTGTNPEPKLTGNDSAQVGGSFNIDLKAENLGGDSAKYFRSFSKRTFDWMMKCRRTLPEEKKE